MPRYSNVSDSSARKLDFYKKKHNIVKQCSLTIETNLSNDVYVDADSDESIGIDMDS